MIQDDAVKKAVSHILQRSERQADIHKLLGTFVDVGVLPQLNNRNNQILFGRRGTGKTHVLRVLESRVLEESGTAVVYIDARTLGSSAQFADPSVSMPTRCLALFRDILNEVYNSLLEYVVANPPHRSNDALAALDELVASINTPVEVLAPETVAATVTTEASRGAHIGATVGARGAGLATGMDETRSSGVKTETAFRVNREDKVQFPAIHYFLSKALDLANVDVYLLLDEWSSLPNDVQPYLAEFLKRGVLPIQRAVLKIAALEHRCNFSVPQNPGILGFEVGADISTAQDLDDYYVFDRNPEQITDAYADMVLRHLAAELPEGYLADNYRVRSGAELASRMFTERATFAELARASEGVVRDLINIFTNAYFHATRRGRDSIDRKAVVDAARQWFEQDKARYLDEDLQGVLRRIVDEVIGARKARSFLLPRELEKHPSVQRLFDARVLHQMQRGYADKDNPGVRYNIYSLDYGTYVDLLGTSKQPELNLQEHDEETLEFVVPYDDKRSIRRIILSEEVLTTSATA